MRAWGGAADLICFPDLPSISFPFPSSIFQVIGSKDLTSLGLSRAEASGSSVGRKDRAVGRDVIFERLFAAGTAVARGISREAQLHRSLLTQSSDLHY